MYYAFLIVANVLLLLEYSFGNVITNFFGFLSMPLLVSLNIFVWLFLIRIYSDWDFLVLSKEMNWFEEYLVRTFATMIALLSTLIILLHGNENPVILTLSLGGFVLSTSYMYLINSTHKTVMEKLSYVALNVFLFSMSAMAFKRALDIIGL